jgi:hypothetical protein
MGCMLGNMMGPDHQSQRANAPFLPNSHLSLTATHPNSHVDVRALGVALAVEAGLSGEEAHDA